MKCDCGSKATHVYAGSKVCESCYQAHAKSDDSPNSVPANYDWAAEMRGRRIK